MYTSYYQPPNTSQNSSLIRRERYSTNLKCVTPELRQERVSALLKERNEKALLKGTVTEFEKSMAYGTLIGGVFGFLKEGMHLALDKKQVLTGIEKLGEFASKTTNALIMGLFFGGALYLSLPGQEWNNARRKLLGKS